MLKNYTARRYYTAHEYSLEWTDEDGNGCSFPCDASGNLFISDMSDAALRNLEYCMTHAEDYAHAGEVVHRSWRAHDPAHGTCSCGREVTLWDQYQGACECECGKWYNMFGQELNPPTCWEDDNYDDYEPEEYFRDYEEERW